MCDRHVGVTLVKIPMMAITAGIVRKGPIHRPRGFVHAV